MINSLGQCDTAQTKARAPAAADAAARARTAVGNGPITTPAATPMSTPTSAAAAFASAPVNAATVLRLAAEGAPIDTRLVDEIRTAIAEGRYPLDPNKIAAAMFAVDVPDAR